MSLIFALHALTPSMIYLLDEVDSALDQVYRSGLTRLLDKLSKDQKIQFFITSFKLAETIDRNDKIFLTTFKNAKSHLA